MGDEGNLEPSERARRIGGGLVWAQVGRFFDIALGLLFSVLIVRALGPQDYAIYAVAWSIVNVAALLASLGYAEVLTRFIPEYRVRDPRLAAGLARRLFVERLLVASVVGLGVWAGVSPLALWTHTAALPQVIPLVVALVLAQGAWEILTGYYTATLRMRDQAGVRVVAQMAALAIALVLFWKIGIEVWIPLAAQLASYVLSSVAYLAGARDLIRFSVPTRPLSAVRRFGSYVWLTNLATFGLASQIDVLLLAVLLSDPKQISFYNVSVILLGRLYTLLTGWMAVLMPSAAEARARNGSAGLVRSFDLYMKLNLAIIVPPFLFVIGWGNSLITAFFGADFAPAASPLRWFAFFSLLSALFGANVCHPLLYVADRQRPLLLFRVLSGALNIVLDVILIPLFGAIGAVMGTGASNLLTHLAEFLLLRSMTSLAYPLGVAFKFALAGVVAVIPAMLIPDQEWLTLIGGAASFALLYLAVIKPLHPLSADDSSILESAVPRLAPVLRWFSA